jgi:HEPN domain-containing protein
MVRYWFAFAEHNLTAAKKMLALGRNFKEIAGFHAQQSAEMAIKGLLTFHKVRIKKTHNFEHLAPLVKPIDPGLAKLLEKWAEPMLNLAVAYRYPDAELPPLTSRKIQSAIKAAQTIQDQCHHLAK